MVDRDYLTFSFHDRDWKSTDTTTFLTIFIAVVSVHNHEAYNDSET